MEFYIKVLQLLLEGAAVTLKLTLLATALGVSLGFVGGVSRLSKNILIRWISTVYVEIIRGSPLLVQLFLIYYGLPRINIVFSPIFAAILGLGINLGAYITEIVRAAIESIDKSQIESAHSLGLSHFQTTIYIILPQAAIVALPGIGNYIVGCLKDTALVSTISVTEILRQANLQVTLTFRSFEIYLLAALVYIMMSIPLSRFVIAIEDKLKVFRGKRM